MHIWLDHSFARKNKHSHRNLGPPSHLGHVVPKFFQYFDNPIRLEFLHGRKDDGVVARPRDGAKCVSCVTNAEDLGGISKIYNIQSFENTPNVLIKRMAVDNHNHLHRDPP
ncbi:MAG: hypothetical protein E6K61_04260 [Nitrospirae bacterium]|nr:MAG: hypothetical protein E6K61_04260 [Nitrospirota bacterium]